jgi:hypothetical protein
MVVLLLQFDQGLRQLLGVRHAVVPLDFVHHVAHAFACYGVGDQHRRLASSPALDAQRTGQGRAVMAIDLAYAPAKGGEFIGLPVKIMPESITSNSLSLLLPTMWESGECAAKSAFMVV